MVNSAVKSNLDSGTHRATRSLFFNRGGRKAIHAKDAESGSRTVLTLRRKLKKITDGITLHLPDRPVGRREFPCASSPLKSN